MIKITCSNPVCGLQFHFDQERFPNAKKVKCPHCETIQPISGAPAPAPERPPVVENDWFKSAPEAGLSTPNFREDNRAVEEDFGNSADDFSVQKRPETARQQQYPQDRQDMSPAPSRPAPSPRPTPAPSPSPASTPSRTSGDIGWLVIHDEATSTDTFALREGLNRIGRESQNTPRDINILIRTNDTYMSREHCEIEARWNTHTKSYEFILSDKSSKNGTYVNGGKKLASHNSVRLKDRDTVQIGRTKLVLVLPSQALDRQQAADLIHSSKYFHTIIE